MLTAKQKLETLKALTGEENDKLLLAYLDRAGAAIINKAYPFKHDVVAVPEKYSTLQVTIAEALYAKRGAEGETQHSENGIVRTYAGADIPPEMLKGVIPFAQPLGGFEREMSCKEQG